MRLGIRISVFVFIFLVIVGAPLYNQLEDQNKTGANNPQKVKNTEKVSISFVGDILLAGHVEDRINIQGVDFPFEKVSPLLSSSDLTMGNLESAVAVSGSPSAKKKYTFRANPKVLEGLKKSGVDILSIANNHILDFGIAAFNQTLENLTAQGLHYVGAGKDQAEAFSPVIINKNGKRIAFLAGSRVIPDVTWYAGENRPGVAGIYNPDKLLAAIKSVKKEADIIVVYLHWGNELETTPRDYQKKLARLLIDNGADVVIGSHPHVLQGFEFYKGKLIAYSLGNFVFTNVRKDTLILTVGFDRSGIESAGIIPCTINNYRPEPIEGSAKKEEFYNMIKNRSFGVNIEDGKLIEAVHDN